MVKVEIENIRILWLTNMNKYWITWLGIVYISITDTGVKTVIESS